MLSDRIYDWSVRVIYLYALVLGQLPAPYNWKTRKFQQTRLYLCYSVVIQCVFLITLAPLEPNHMEWKNNYLQNMPILIVCYYIGLIARVMTIVVCSVVIWLYRRQIIDIYELYTRLKENEDNFYQHQILTEDVRNAAKKIKLYTMYKLGICHIHILAMCSMYFLMQRQLSASIVRLVASNFLQSFLLAVANMYFYMIVSRMHLHFLCINKSLERIALQRISPNIMKHCWYFYSAHFQCYQLSKRILQICQPVIIVTLIKMFITNVISLYHAVLFMDGSIESEDTDDLMGTLLIIAFYWDTMFTITTIDNILMSCNRTADILGHLLSFVVEDHTSDEFTKMLSQFHEYLACHKLDFYIFGLFPLNMASGLQFFISTLVHLIVVIQFDLKWRN